MNQSLAPYPDYKPAGLPWLDKVPAHWEIKRAKQVFRTIDQRSETGLEEKLTVSSKNGVVPRREQKVTMFMAASYVGHKLCWPGDLVVNSLWAWANGLGFAKHHGIISTAYSVYRPLPEYAKAGPYLDYLLRSSVFQWEFQVGSKGIWISRLQLTDDTFMRMPILLPPIPEQQRMVSFLDAKGRQIARLLRHKRQLIKLLNEQKQALIHRAVTQGLDANAPRKDSGVAGLGEMPAHWEVRRLKTVSKFVTSGSRGWAEFYSDEGAIFLRIGNLSVTSIDLKLHNLQRVTPPKGAEGERTRVQPNDLLISITALLGAIGVVPEEVKDAYVNQHTALVRLKLNLVNPRWAAYCLNSEIGKQQFKALTNGGTKEGLTLGDVAALTILYPPYQEQCELANFIDEQVADFDKIIARAQREIELIQEYRTRLVTDVVTGRVDVRHLANTENDILLPGEIELDDEEDESEEELATVEATDE